MLGYSKKLYKIPNYGSTFFAVLSQKVKKTCSKTETVLGFSNSPPKRNRISGAILVPPPPPPTRICY